VARSGRVICGTQNTTPIEGKELRFTTVDEE